MNNALYEAAWHRPAERWLSISLNSGRFCHVFVMGALPTPTLKHVVPLFGDDRYYLRFPLGKAIRPEISDAIIAMLDGSGTVGGP